MWGGRAARTSFTTSGFTKDGIPTCVSDTLKQEAVFANASQLYRNLGNRVDSGDFDGCENDISSHSTGLHFCTEVKEFRVCVRNVTTMLIIAVLPPFPLEAIPGTPSATNTSCRCALSIPEETTMKSSHAFRVRACHLRMGLAIAAALGTIALAEAGGPFRNPLRQRTSVEQLAEKIDRLNGHIHEYGTVVGKHPDVWGDGRLSKHRADIDNEFKKDLAGFEFRLNATVSESDSAFLGQALALSSIANGGQLLGTTPPNSPPQTASATIGLISTATSSTDPTNLIPRTGPPTNNPFVNPTSNNGRIGIALEPHLVLDQKNRYLQHLNELRRMNESDDVADSPGYTLNVVRLPISIVPGRKTSHGYGAEIMYTATPYLSDDLLPSTTQMLIRGDLIEANTSTLLRQVLSEPSAKANSENKPSNEGGQPKQQTPGTKAFTFSAGPTGNSTSIPKLPSSVFEDEVKFVLQPLETRAEDALDINRRPGKEPLYLDVRNFLLQEYAAAETLMSQPSSELLWSLFCDAELEAAIVAERKSILLDKRNQFLTALHAVRNRNEYVPSATILEHVALEQELSSSRLAWLMLLHAAELNVALKRDMRRIAVEKNCPCACGEELMFVGPNPSAEARAIFNEYVRCRWPVIVFALDPANQEQNIGLTSSRRREIQLVAALAAANGPFSAQKLSRFVRRMEMDLATIDLNRTDVGISHGNDTFGWRFTPRLQAPNIDSNLKVITRDLLIGGPTREEELKHRKLEPGIRECTAVVLMPSFVPYVTFDSRSSWFPLSQYQAKSRVMDLEDSVELSREITALRQLSQSCVKDAHLYRDGEVHRLLRSVEQLDRSLPLQTQYVQMPFDTSVVPSDLFTPGASGLVPALEGWYGQPGILVQDQTAIRAVGSRLQSIRDRVDRARKAQLDAIIAGKPADQVKLIGDELTTAQAAETAALADAKLVAAANVPTTTVFLYGKHFSLFNMQVIAGGVDVTPSVVVLSRNLCQVTIPASVSTLVEKQYGKDVPVVDVHLATTYGMTSRLTIPAIGPTPSATPPTNDDIKKLTDRVSAIENATAAWTLAWGTTDILDLTVDVQGKSLKVANPQLGGTPVALSDRIELTLNEAGVPYENRGTPPNAQFAGWLVDGKDKTKKSVVGPVKILEEHGKAWLVLSDILPKIEAAINMAATRPAPQAQTSYELIGFVRIPGDENRPTYRIAKSLAIRVQSLECIPTSSALPPPPKPANPTATPPAETRQDLP